MFNLYTQSILLAIDIFFIQPVLILNVYMYGNIHKTVIRETIGFRNLYR